MLIALVIIANNAQNVIHRAGQKSQVF